MEQFKIMSDIASIRIFWEDTESSCLISNRYADGTTHVIITTNPADIDYFKEEFGAKYTGDAITANDYTYISDYDLNDNFKHTSSDHKLEPGNYKIYVAEQIVILFKFKFF